MDYIELSSSSPHHIAGVNGTKESNLNASANLHPESIKQKEIDENTGLFFKIVLVVFSSFALFAQGFLVYKLFRYLLKH